MYLPEDVKYMIDQLYDHGYEAYAVGGCVRDMILEREPDDWDITTSAMPEETKELFERTFDTGIEHGTITILLNGVGYEVTTYRVDGKYEDNRHPSEVSFTRSLEEDLRRRDFTINAMAYNDREGLVDIFGGVKDIERKCIRCVGNAEARFGEDALRILRAIRFSAQLGFQIEEETCNGIKELAQTLDKISAERIQVELVKLLVSPHPEYLDIAYQLGVTKVIFPEWDAMMNTTQENVHHIYNVGQHTLEALKFTKPEKILRLSILLHDVAKPQNKVIKEGIAHFYGHDKDGEQIAKIILKRWKFDNDTLKKVTKLVYWHDYRIEATFRNVRRAMANMGAELFPLYLEIRYADTMAQSMYQREEKLQNIQELRQCYEEIQRRGECTTLKELNISGNDLIEIGVSRGRQVGEILSKLLEVVIDNPKYNDKEYLLSYVQDKILK